MKESGRKCDHNLRKTSKRKSHMDSKLSSIRKFYPGIQNKPVTNVQSSPQTLMARKFPNDNIALSTADNICKLALLRQRHEVKGRGIYVSGNLMV